jgi:hypothetical protein
MWKNVDAVATRTRGQAIGVIMRRFRHEPISTRMTRLGA